MWGIVIEGLGLCVLKLSRVPEEMGMTELMMAHALCFCQAELFIVTPTYAALFTFRRQTRALLKSGLCTQTARVQPLHRHYQLWDLHAVPQSSHL